MALIEIGGGLSRGLDPARGGPAGPVGGREPERRLRGLLRCRRPRGHGAPPRFRGDRAFPPVAAPVRPADLPGADPLPSDAAHRRRDPPQDGGGRAAPRRPPPPGLRLLRGARPGPRHSAGGGARDPLCGRSRFPGGASAARRCAQPCLARPLPRRGPNPARRPAGAAQPPPGRVEGGPQHHTRAPGARRDRGGVAAPLERRLRRERRKPDLGRDPAPGGAGHRGS